MGWMCEESRAHVHCVFWFVKKVREHIGVEVYIACLAAFSSPEPSKTPVRNQDIGLILHQVRESCLSEGILCRKTWQRESRYFLAVRSNFPLLSFAM